MMHLTQVAETHAYRYPVEHAEREHRTRIALLVASVRRPAIAAAIPAPRRPLIPRIAGALGLF